MSKTPTNGSDAAPAPGPTAELVEPELPSAPSWAGPPIQVAQVYWRKDVSLQIPGGGAAQTRLVAWPEAKIEPDYVIQFLPKIRQFWVCYLRASEGPAANPARWIPADHAVTWQEWRGEIDIPAAARRRRELAARGRLEALAG